MTTKLNKRERKAAQLLRHYATCEALGKYLGMTNPDGKKISVALWKAEWTSHQSAERLCNGEIDQNMHDEYVTLTKSRVKKALGALPPGFFVNSDPRGYALKIDNETPEGKALIDACNLQTDWGGYGILSPEITGD